MRISKSELEAMKMMPNYVLVKPDRLAEDEYNLKSGIKLYIDTKYETSLHINIWGTVVKSPRKLFYKNLTDGSLPWDTDLEISEGDYVMYDFVAAAQALGKLYDPNFEGDDTKYIFCEDELYIVFRYNDLFLKKKGDDITMLNGFVLVEPVSEDEISSDVIILLEQKQSVRYGIVAYKGSMIREYFSIHPKEPIVRDYCYEIQVKDGVPCNIKGKDIGVGDKICFDKYADIDCEVETHQKLPKKYFRMQRKEIAAIIPK